MQFNIIIPVQIRNSLAKMIQSVKTENRIEMATERKIFENKTTLQSMIRAFSSGCSQATTLILREERASWSFLERIQRILMISKYGLTSFCHQSNGHPYRFFLEHWGKYNQKSSKTCPNHPCMCQLHSSPRACSPPDVWVLPCPGSMESFPSCVQQ